MPENHLVNVHSSGKYWNETGCRNCPGLRTPSIHANCYDLMSSEIVTGRSTTSQEVLAAPRIQPRSRSRDHRSRYFGVRFRPDLSKWVAEIRVAEWKAVDKKVWLGTFETEEGAARAVDAARKLLNCRKKRPSNFPCENLTKYSERIPSDLRLTDLNSSTMFKHVTQFVKKKSQQYAATFNQEDFQALLSELPELKIAPQDPLDNTTYSQESIEEVPADRAESMEDIKPCIMRTVPAASVSDESEFEATHSRRHRHHQSHSHSHSVSSAPQSWLAEDAGEGNCSLGIYQDMPDAKRLKQEPMVIMDDVEMFHYRESTEVYSCNSTFDLLHSNFSGIDYEHTDAEGDEFGEHLGLTQECSIVDPCFYEWGTPNLQCYSETGPCTTWQANHSMAMNVELLHESIFDHIVDEETTPTWLQTTQPFTSSYNGRESHNAFPSRVLNPYISPGVTMNPSSPPWSPSAVQTSSHAPEYLNTSHGLQGDGTASYGYCCPDDDSNLYNEHYPRFLS